MLGNLPAQFVSTETDLSQVIENALMFCSNFIVHGSNGAMVCPHAVYIDQSNISEITARVLVRYGIDTILTPAQRNNEPKRFLWKLSARESVFVEQVSFEQKCDHFQFVLLEKGNEKSIQTQFQATAESFIMA